MRSIPPNEALCSVPWSSFSKDGVPVQVRPEDMVALLIDDGSRSVYWWHSGGGETVSSGEERIIEFLGRQHKSGKC